MIDPATHAVKATLPTAKILSVEQIGDLTYHGEDSMLNRLTDEERTKFVNDLYQMARKAAEDSSLKQDAAAQVSERLNQLLSHNGQNFELIWSNNPSQSSTLIP